MIIMHRCLNSVEENVRVILVTWLKEHSTELSKALEAMPWNIRLKSIDVKMERSGNSVRITRTPVLVYTPNFQLGVTAPIQGSSQEARRALTKLFDIKKESCLLISLARKINSAFTDHNIKLPRNRITWGLVELLMYLFEVDVNSLEEEPLLIHYPFKAYKIKYEIENLSEVLIRLDEALSKFIAKLLLPGNRPVKVRSLIFVRLQELDANELLESLIFEDCLIQRVNSRTIAMAILATNGHTPASSTISDVALFSSLEDLCIETVFAVDLQPDPRRWSIYEAHCILHSEALKKLRKAVGLLKVYDPDMVIINAVYHVDAIWPDSPTALRMVTRMGSGLNPLGDTGSLKPSGTIVNSEYTLFFLPAGKKRTKSWNCVKESFEKLNKLSKLSDKRLIEVLRIVLADLAREHEILSMEEKLVQLCRILESLSYIYAYVRGNSISKLKVDSAGSIINVLTKHGFELSAQDKELIKRIYKRRSVIGAHGLRIKRILLGMMKNLDSKAEVLDELIRTRDLTCRVLQKIIRDI